MITTDALAARLEKKSHSPGCINAVTAFRLRTLDEALRMAYRFVGGNISYSQPASDMGPEPSDRFSYDAGPVLAFIQTALGQSHDEIMASPTDSE